MHFIKNMILLLRIEVIIFNLTIIWSKIMNKDPVESLLSRVDKLFENNGLIKYAPNFVSKWKDFEESVYWRKFHSHGAKFPFLYDKRWEEKSFDDRVRFAGYCDTLLGEGMDKNAINFDDLELLDKRLDEIDRDISSGKIRVEGYEDVRDPKLVPLKTKLVIIKRCYQNRADYTKGDRSLLQEQSAEENASATAEFNKVLDVLFNPSPNNYYNRANSAFRDYFKDLKSMKVVVGGDFRASSVFAQTTQTVPIRIEFNPRHYFKIYLALKRLSERRKLGPDDLVHISVLFHEYQHALHVMHNKNFILPDKEKPDGQARALYESMNEMVARLEMSRVLTNMYGGTGYDDTEYFGILNSSSFTRAEIPVLYEEFSLFNRLTGGERSLINDKNSSPQMDPELLCDIIDQIKYVLHYETFDEKIGEKVGKRLELLYHEHSWKFKNKDRKDYEDIVKLISKKFTYLYNFGKKTEDEKEEKNKDEEKEKNKKNIIVVERVEKEISSNGVEITKTYLTTLEELEKKTQ